MNAEATINTSLRIGSAVALLAMCGCASIESAEPVSTHRGETSAVQRAGPVGDAGSQEGSMAYASGVRSGTELAELTERTAAAPTEDAADAAGESRTVSDRRLTLRQKRIFVLGLAAREKN
jgi:hypothetical protein